MDDVSLAERSPTSPYSWSTVLKAKRKPPAVKNELPPRQASGAFSSTRTRAPCSRAESAAHSAALPPPTTMTSYARVVMLGHDLADLDLGLDVRVVRDVGHDLLAVTSHALLKISQRVEVDVADTHVGRRRPRGAAGH